MNDVICSQTQSDVATPPFDMAAAMLPRIIAVAALAASADQCPQHDVVNVSLSRTVTSNVLWLLEAVV